MFYVYLIQNEISKEIYIGYTTDLKRRLLEHNKMRNDSTKRIEGKWILIYYESFLNALDAMNRERRLKNHGRAKQELYKRIANCLL